VLKAKKRRTDQERRRSCGRIACPKGADRSSLPRTDCVAEMSQNLLAAGEGATVTHKLPSRHSLRQAENIPAQRDISYDDLDKFRYYTIGPACAFMCRFALFPFALVKTRLQMQKGGVQLPSNALTGMGTAKAAEIIRYSGTLDAFRKIVHHEGPRGLFKGFGVSCIGIVSGQLYITTYELIRQEAGRMNDVHDIFSPPTMDVVRNAVAGGTASLLSQTVVVPVDIVSQKQMMMSREKMPLSMVQLSRDIFAREGIMGFYRGFFASVMVCHHRFSPCATANAQIYVFHRLLCRFSNICISDMFKDAGKMQTGLMAILMFLFYRTHVAGVRAFLSNMVGKLWVHPAKARAACKVQQCGTITSKTSGSIRRCGWRHSHPCH